MDECSVPRNRRQLSGVADWFPREGARELVSIGMAPRFMDSASARRVLVEGKFAPDREILLEESVRDQMKGQSDPTAKIEGLQFRTHEIGFRTVSSVPCLVSIANSWFPAWKAEVNGVPTPVIKANVAFQAIEVSAGVHQVRFWYSANSFFAGLAVTVMTSVVMCWIWRRGGRGVEGKSTAQADLP